MSKTELALHLLKKDFQRECIFFVALLLLGVIFLLVDLYRMRAECKNSPKRKKKKKGKKTNEKNYGGLYRDCAFLVVILIWSFLELRPVYLDIRNEQIVSVSGEYSHMPQSTYRLNALRPGEVRAVIGGKKRTLFLPRTAESAFPNGKELKGTFWYAKDSCTLLIFETEDGFVYHP